MKPTAPLVDLAKTASYEKRPQEEVMPKNSKVHRQADAMKRAGVPESIAIATAQKRTGQSYATGKKLPPAPKGGKK